MFYAELVGPTSTIAENVCYLENFFLYPDTLCNDNCTPSDSWYYVGDIYYGIRLYSANTCEFNDIDCPIGPGCWTTGAGLPPYPQNLSNSSCGCTIWEYVPGYGPPVIIQPSWSCPTPVNTWIDDYGDGSVYHAGVPCYSCFGDCYDCSMAPPYSYPYPLP